MGKTKAGKSTLHTIMTGQGWDAIGVGKQRTTRLNRVYEWNNIRIIDTPGIGAPDGKTDEEIAQSVIQESDVICYVVTNDSIQETEFEFLKLLKENAKPLIILLNVHKNFRDSRRGNYELERFLQNPDKLFPMDGSSGLGGHTVRQERDRLRTKVRSIALQLSAAVTIEGTVLARAVGTDADIDALAKQAESKVHNHCEKAQAKMEEAVREAVESLQEEVKKVLNSDLAQAFVARLEVNQKVSARNVESGVDVERLRGQVEMLQNIGEQVGVGITKLATKTGATSTGQAFLRADNAAGSTLHKGVYNVGKFVGFKFKPWLAVNIAKGIGNVAKVVGPVLSVGMLAVDVYAKQQEEEHHKVIRQSFSAT